MYDKTVKFGNSIINHGKYNNRIYIMKLSEEDYHEIIIRLDDLAEENGYTKIFAKVPSFAKDNFEENRYTIEASIPKFYNYEQDMFFMSKFVNENRKMSDRTEIIKNVINIANRKQTLDTQPKLPKDYHYKICNKHDADQMANMYRNVFKTYPFPIHEPNYIKQTMEDNIIYFGISHGDKLVSLSSSEVDQESQNVEMTDFATLPEYRGNGFAMFLLDKMEKEMKHKGIKTAYTIARAVSFGMNITFAKLGYKYSGTLINNTNISGALESMNVWYKYL